MNVAVLGTGMVGQTIATALVAAGHTVCMGSRSGENPKAVDWSSSAGPGGTHGTFAEAARSADLIFNCTSGVASLEALRQAGEENLRGKVLIDVANPLDFSRGMPPTLTVCNTDSLAEQIQRAFPGAKVVKALNTMNRQIMVDPGRLPGMHHVFVSGDDAEAKVAVAALLSRTFGWPPASVVDLGDISTARGPEMLLPLWIRLWGALGTADFNFHLAGAPSRPPVGAVEALPAAPA
jgi:8-hydroxy-5-deazaflavin:NADPH oxidoreductase